LTDRKRKEKIVGRLLIHKKKVKMTDYTLGVNTYFMTTRWPSPSEKFRLVREKLALDCLQYSLDNFQVDWPQVYRRKQIQEIRKAAERYRVNIHSVFTGSGHHDNSFLYHPDKEWRQYSLKWFKAAVCFAREIGASGAGGFTGALSLSESKDLAVRKKRMQEAMDLWCQLSEEAAKQRLEFLLIEPMSVRREPPCTIRESLEMMERLNEKACLPVRLCLDVGHHLARTGKERREKNPYEWLRYCSCWAKAVHLHQTDGITSRHWPFTFSYNRRGKIRADKVLRAIEDSGVPQMTLLVEIFVPVFEPGDDRALEQVRLSVNYWKKALRRRVKTYRQATVRKEGKE